MTRWTEIPAYLYRNPLPDDELQEVYVKAAEKKWAECADHREALRLEVSDLRAMKRRDLTAEAWSALVDELAERTAWLEEAYEAEAKALAFLQRARAALDAYRKHRRLRG